MASSTLCRSLTPAADLVVSCSVLDRDTAHGGDAGLAEMERVCAPGGMVVVVWPPNHLDWLTAHGYTHLSFPGPMSMEFRDTAEAIEMTEIFYPHAAAEVRARNTCARRLRRARRQSTPRPRVQEETPHVRLALIASLVSPIREPQCGGAQSFLADLAAGLARRGHEVDVFAASGSEIDGVRCVDVGVEASALQGFLYHAGATPPADNSVFEAAYARVFGAIGERSYDVVHNHAFDAPAIRLATAVDAPVIHTMHLPPEASVVHALLDASNAFNPPVIATVSEAQARAWREHVTINLVLPVRIPTARIPWSVTPGSGVVFAGRFSPEKGAAEAIAIARRAGLLDRPVR